MNSRHLQLYITAETPCSYFTGRKSRNLVPDPVVPMNMPIYSQLIQHGFRRSGSYSYRPHCKHCHDCIACRIPVHDFQANRSQQRCYKRNKDLKLSVVKACFTEEYFVLYSRYLNSRHGDGSMADPTKEDFEQFLYSDWSNTRFLELRLNGQLLAVAVTDFTSQALSAVYSFFEPELAKRSLGTCCILKQIEYAKELGLEYLYLGYWISKHNKMHYKRNFTPLQLYIDEQWQELDTAIERT
mgnify:CR=1 FL=1